LLAASFCRASSWHVQSAIWSSTEAVSALISATCRTCESNRPSQMEPIFV
jgi:hypothetical protein